MVYTLNEQGYEDIIRRNLLINSINLEIF